MGISRHSPDAVIESLGSIFWASLAIRNLLDPLLSCAALVVEGDDPLGRPRQVGHDEADARVKLARMPFDLCHNRPDFLPALRLIAEPGVVAANLMRRSADRALEQVSNPILQNAVTRQPDRIADALGFEELVHLGIGESHVAVK
jgi:hypothetical protein